MNASWKSVLEFLRTDTRKAISAARGGQFPTDSLEEYIKKILAQPVTDDPFQIRVRRLAALISPRRFAFYSEARLAAFSQITPNIYSASSRRAKSAPHTNPARLPDLAAYNRALAAMAEVLKDPEGDKCGVLLWGETGLGKTRTLYALGRLIISMNNEVRVVTTAEIKAASTPGAWRELKTDIMDDYRAVLIDDLSHTRFTEAYAANLLDLIESITAKCYLPLVVSVQCSGRDLVSKWCAGDRELKPTAEAIARRLGDFLVPIEFRAPKPTRLPAATPNR